MPKRNQRSFEVTATYLRLLDGEPPSPPDWPAAAELIDAGMATGRVHRSAETAPGQIDLLTGFAPTLSGRLYAQQLRESQRAQSLAGRLQKWVWALAGALCGMLLNALSGLLTEVMKRLLGW